MDNSTITDLNDLIIDNRTFELIANCFNNSSFMIPGKEELMAYGYNIDDLRIKPVSKLQAFRYWITNSCIVYLLWENNIETVAESIYDILEWDGYFGINFKDELN